MVGYKDGNYIVPKIKVQNQTTKINNSTNRGGRVAVIGAFPSEDVGIHSFATLRDLRRFYGIVSGTTSETDFSGAKACARIFMDGVDGCKGATEVITCNIATKKASGTVSGSVASGSENETITSGSDVHADEITYAKGSDYDLELTYTKLCTALAKLKGESLDILFVADTFQNLGEQSEFTTSSDEPKCIPGFKKVKNFLADEFELQRPSQLVAPLYVGTGSSSSSNGLNEEAIDLTKAKTVANLFVDNPYLLDGLYWQTFNLDLTSGVYSCDLIESAAHMCGFIAATYVEDSLTRKDIPGILKVNEEVYFGEDNLGYQLTEAGIHVIRTKSRTDNSYCVNNSMLPSEYDISHIRSISYLIKQYDLESILGEHNSIGNIESFKAQLKAVNKQVMESLSIFNSIDTDDMEVVNSHELLINLKVDMAGVIIVVDLGVNMTVE